DAVAVQLNEVRATGTAEAVGPRPDGHGARGTGHVDELHDHAGAVVCRLRADDGDAGIRDEQRGVLAGERARAGARVWRAHVQRVACGPAAPGRLGAVAARR